MSSQLIPIAIFDKPATSADAAIRMMIETALASSNPLLIRTFTEDVLSKIIRLSSEKFCDEVSVAYIRATDSHEVGISDTRKCVVTPTGVLTLYASTDALGKWWSEDPLEVHVDNHRKYQIMQSPPGHALIHELERHLIDRYTQDIPRRRKEPSSYVSMIPENYPTWFQLLGNTDKDISQFVQRYELALCADFSCYMDSRKMSATRFVRTFFVPHRTYEDWYAGKRFCPGYTRYLIAAQLGDVL